MDLSPTSRPPAPGGRLTPGERSKAKLADRASQIITRVLEPEERILAGARVQSGLSDWWFLLPRDAPLVAFFQRHYYLALSDRRLIFCKVSYWTDLPVKVTRAVSRTDATIAGYKPGRVFSTFQLGYPGRRRPLTLRARGAWHQETERLLGVLAGLA